MLTKLSQWVPIQFFSLLYRFLSKSRDLNCSTKPRRCSLLYISFRTMDCVIIPHQVLLSKTAKHWDGFVSHCICDLVKVLKLPSCDSRTPKSPLRGHLKVRIKIVNLGPKSVTNLDKNHKFWPKCCSPYKLADQIRSGRE